MKTPCNCNVLQGNLIQYGEVPMKKILICLLLLAMFCMSACNNGNNDVNTDENTDKTSVGDTTEATTTQAQTEDPHEGWTWLLGEVYIPDLPFENWEGQNQDNISCYTIFISSHDSAAFHTYVQSLTDFGYTIEQTESYSYTGTDPENRSIHFTDHENGQMQISIYY